MQTMTTALSVLFTLLNPQSQPSYADENGLLTTTVRPTTSGEEQSSIQSLKSMIQEYFPGKVSSSTTIPLPDFPRLPLPSLESTTVSGKQLFTTVISDWRILATIAGLVYAIDNFYSTKELKQAKEDKDFRIQELEKTIQDLEQLNTESQGNLAKLEMNAKHLNEEVSKLQQDLKSKLLKIDSMESQLISLQQSNKGVSNTVNDDLAQALKKIQVLEQETSVMKASQQAWMKDAKQYEIIKSREDEILVSVKSFLLDKGFISQGVANMLIPGTLPSILQECRANSADVSGKVSSADNSEVIDLQQKLENSKKRISKLHDQLAEANLEKAQALLAQEGNQEMKEKMALLEADVARLQAELAASLKSTKTKTRAKSDDATLKNLQSQLVSNEKEFQEKLSLKDAELLQLRNDVASLTKNLETMQVKLNEAETVSSSKRKSSQSDMEEYLSQLKAENEDLKSRLLTSDDKLLELTNDMQKKLDNAKDMAKRLNAQMLTKVSEFEKREAQSDIFVFKQLHILTSRIVLEQLTEAKDMVAKLTEKTEMAPAAETTKKSEAVDFEEPLPKKKSTVRKARDEPSSSKAGLPTDEAASVGIMVIFLDLACFKSKHTRIAKYKLRREPTAH